MVFKNFKLVNFLRYHWHKHETITKIKMTNSRDLDFRYRRPHYRPMKLMQKLFVLIMLMKVLNTCVSYKIAVAILTADALN